MNRMERRRQIKGMRHDQKHQELIKTAVKHLSAGRPDRAKQLLTRAVKQAPDDATSIHFLGVANYQSGDYVAAKEELIKAIEIAPEYAEAQNSLGNIYLVERNYNLAINCYNKSISLQPSYANAHTNLGEALIGNGDLEDAEISFRRAIEIDEQALEPCYRLATTLLGLGKACDALVEAERCLAINQWCQNALAAKVMALQLLDRQGEADVLQDFRRLVYSPRVECPIGYESDGDFNYALSEAVKVCPTLNWQPLNRVTQNGAVTDNMLLKPDRAIQEFEKALRVSIDQWIKSLEPKIDHPFLNRIPSNYKLKFIASILKAGGWHPPHLHEGAWLSGVYYVNSPLINYEAVDEQVSVLNPESDQDGWLEFGRPDYILPADFNPKTTSLPPIVGIARCFPSYFFHGTIPFSVSGERIGIAFDVYPVD